MVLSTVIAYGKTYTEHSTGLWLVVSLRTSRLKGSVAAKETHKRGVYYWAGSSEEIPLEDQVKGRGELGRR